LFLVERIGKMSTVRSKVKHEVDEYANFDLYGDDDEGDIIPSDFKLNRSHMSGTKILKPSVLPKSGTSINRSDCFEATPAVVHFSGFATGNTYSQEIFVLNHSRTSQRLQLIPPVSSEFLVSCDKVGLLAPGMRQKITVKFEPQEYKYHYDCLRVRGENQSLLIPLHGYPVANKVFFPSSIVFEKTPLCDVATKV
jgi:hypothetical protein